MAKKKLKEKPASGIEHEEREERIRQLSEILRERFGYSGEEADDLARIIRGSRENVKKWLVKEGNMQGLVRIYKTFGNGDIKDGRKRLFDLADEMKRLKIFFETDREQFLLLQDRLFTLAIGMSSGRIDVDLKELTALLCLAWAKERE